MKNALICCCLFFVITVQAQKKLTPATKSAVTGIDLPTGSKQDGRVWSQSLAGVLMETESNKKKTTLRTAEVLVLPPASISKFNRDSLAQRLSTKNWKIVAVEDNNYLWLQRDNSFVITYFSMDTKGVNLYFAEAVTTPDFAVPVINTIGNSTVTQPITPPEQNNSADTKSNSSVLGIWTMTSSDQSSWRTNNGIMNYTKRQYTFYENGTYTFTSRAFDPLMDKILLGNENGTFQINGTSLTIIPQKSVLEAWSKKDGGDQWGTKMSAQNITLEKVTYQFTKHYMSGIREWNLVLQAGAPTNREGPFSSNTSFSNAYYYSPISASNPAIALPDGQKIKTEEKAKGSTLQTPAATNNTTPIIGTWGISVVVPYRSGTEGTAGSNIKQYTFNADGTYRFYVKTFKYSFDKILLTKETGTYQVIGDKLTIRPQMSVIESWSKKDGTDNWGKLVSTQNKALEVTSYQFTKHYSAGMQEWNLVLQASKETQRDGPYNGGTAFSNAWLYSTPCNKCLIELPAGN